MTVSKKRYFLFLLLFFVGFISRARNGLTFPISCRICQHKKMEKRKKRRKRRKKKKKTKKKTKKKKKKEEEEERKKKDG